MEFKAKEEGYEVSAIFHGVNEKNLKNHKILKDKSIELLKKTGFTVLESIDHEFSPQGYTLVVLLSESHFAIHTYPEFSSIYFHLYSCGDKSEKLLFDGLKEILNPSKIEMSRKSIRVNL
jgi:S-adenosylmethionine decarboxylase